MSKSDYNDNDDSKKKPPKDPNIVNIATKNLNFHGLYELNQYKHVCQLYDVHNRIELDYDVVFGIQLILNKYDLPNLLAIKLVFNSVTHSTIDRDIIELLQHQNLIEYSNQKNMCKLHIGRLFWNPNEPIVPKFLDWEPVLYIVFRQALPSLAKNGDLHLKMLNYEREHRGIEYNVMERAEDKKWKIKKSHGRQDRQDRQDRQGGNDDDEEGVEQLRDMFGGPMYRTLVQECTMLDAKQMNTIMTNNLPQSQAPPWSSSIKYSNKMIDNQFKLCQLLLKTIGYNSNININEQGFVNCQDYTQNLLCYNTTCHDIKMKNDTLLDVTVPNINAVTTFISLKTPRDVRYVEYRDVKSKTNAYCCYTDLTSSKHAAVDKDASFVLQPFTAAIKSLNEDNNDYKSSTKSTSNKSRLFKKNKKINDNDTVANPMTRSRTTLQLMQCVKQMPYELVFLVMNYHSIQQEQVNIPSYISNGPLCDDELTATQQLPITIVKSINTTVFKDVKGLDDDDDNDDNNNKNDQDELTKSTAVVINNSCITKKRRQELDYYKYKDVYSQKSHDYKKVYSDYH